MTAARLKSQCFPDGAMVSYVRVFVDGVLAGNDFACRWYYNGGMVVCWVTQLVVHRNYRRQGLAVGLLLSIKNESDNFYGIVSSHPAACLAAAKAFGRKYDLTLARPQ